MVMLNRLAFVVIPLLLTLYLAHTVWGSAAVEGVMIILTVLLYGIALKDAGRTEAILNGLFLVGALVLIRLSGAGFTEAVTGMTTMVNLILFILFVPLISSPIKAYLPDVQDVLHHLKQKVSPLTLSEGFTFVMSLLINLSSVPLNTRIFKGDLPEEAYPRLIALQNRAFGLAILVTPVGAAITLTVSYTGVSYLGLVPVQLAVAGAALVLSRMMVNRSVSVPADAREEEERAVNRARLVKMFLPFLLFLAVLVTFELRSDFGMMDIILMVVVPYSLIWGVLTGQFGQWKTDAVSQVKGVTGFFRQFSVILIAGWFIASLNLYLDSGDALLYLAAFTAGVPVFVILVLIMAVMVGASLIGIHQFVILVLFLELFTSVEPFMPMPLLGSFLMIGMVAGMLLSPYSGLNLMVQGSFPGYTSASVARLQWRFMAVFLTGLVMVYSLIAMM
ncbi:hypothetical protein Bsel_0957 [[Bacillus] selenitireducens MLS10]|uniref:Uncharacterized protein n=2 Tax=Salisediminibacterium selenitireducens TaxID=85683 RepID=D6Y088_BACIE|nr:hypothetical protein Bsel_0957 [[Bacillus] selenitireducens MLS10]